MICYGICYLVALKVPIESHLLKRLMFESKYMALHFLNDSSEVVAGVQLLKPEIVQLFEHGGNIVDINWLDFIAIITVVIFGSRHWIGNSFKDFLLNGDIANMLFIGMVEHEIDVHRVVVAY